MLPVRMIDQIDISRARWHLPAIFCPRSTCQPCHPLHGGSKNLVDRLINVEHGHFLAEPIPRARLLELPGDDHLFFIHEQIGDAIEEFLTGSISTAGSHRVLATVLFTDSARLRQPNN